MRLLQHRLNLIFFLLWPILAAWISLTFPINALFSSVVFYGIPAGLLSFYRPEYIKKSLVVSLSGIPFLIIVDYIAELTGAWLWPLPHSVFPFKLFGYVSAEVLLWGFLHAYVVIMFFQYFFEKTFIKKILDTRSEKAILLSTITFIIFIAALFIHPDILNIPYWYLVFGTIGILPLVVFEDWKYPKVFHRLLKTSAYFFYLNFTYELTALKVGWWSFPSKQFIGYVSFFDITFPFEEFFFWIVLFTLAILSYYEYFFNRER